MNQEEKYQYMTTESVEKLIAKLSIPTIISMLISTFYNMVDTYFVGKIDTQATAAVGIVLSVMGIIQAVGFLFGHGSGIYISRKLGEKKIEEAKSMLTTGFVYSIIVGLIIMVVGLLFLEPIAYGLGSTKTIMPYTKKYLSYILIGAPYMTAALVLNNQLRYQGNAVYAMVGIVSGAVINIILDPILIFTFDMGIQGAALATIISQFISFVLLLIGTRKGGNIRIKLSSMNFSLEYLKHLIKGGFPSLCRQGLASIAIISLNTASKPFGDAVIAGMSIVSRITMFANSVVIGFGQGFQPVCGFNYGAKQYARVRKSFYFCVKTSFIFLILVSIVSIIVAPNLVSLFRKGDFDVIKAGSIALRFQCITFPLNSWIILTNMMLQAIGKPLSASITAIARQGFFYLPLIWVLPVLFGTIGIYIAQPVADILTLILVIPISLKVLKELKSNI